MPQQLLLAPDANADITTKKQFHFDSLADFLYYLDYLSDTKISTESAPVGPSPYDCFPKKAYFDSESLKNCHIGNSVLLVDKYVKCSIPDVQLELLFESQGIDNYSACLHPDYNFKHRICTKQNIISELFAPNISGEHFNPYTRWNSCVANGSRTCSKLLDLAGLDQVDVSYGPKGHYNIFLDVVFTFPDIVDFYIMNPDCRCRSGHKISKNGNVHKSELQVLQMHFLDRINRCRSELLQKLQEFFGVPSGNIMGLSSNLHIWSSEFPVIPNCHLHTLIPFFSYYKSPDVPSGFLKDFVMNFNFWSDISGNTDILTYSDIVCFVNNPQIRDVSKGRVNFKDVSIAEKFIINGSAYKQLRISLSAALAEKFNFVPIPWSSPTKPVDIDSLKELWSDIVYSEFQDIMEHWAPLDIFVKWVPHFNKSKLLHSLQYKSRPPVLDLDLFFKKCPGVVLNYNKVDFSRVLDFISNKLDVAIRCSDIDAINRYESMLKKAERIADCYTNQDILKWLQFLSVWVNETKVYGFWRNIQRYLLDPDHKFLIESVVCPICNGVISDTGIKTRFCVVDYVIVRSGSAFMIYDLGGDG